MSLAEFVEKADLHRAREQCRWKKHEHGWKKDFS